MEENKGVKEVTVKPSTANKDLIESYNFATLRDSIGLYGQRLMLRLIEAANSAGVTEGLNFKAGDCRPICPSSVEPDLFGHTRISMPKSAIMGDSSEYTKATVDVEACMRHIIKYTDENGDLVMFPFLTYAKCTKGNIIIEVREELWQQMLNFTKGFRKFELNVALALKSKYSLRLYRLISGQANPLNYSIDELRQIIGTTWTEQVTKGRKVTLETKSLYPKVSDFIKYVIRPAQAELDACSPWTFEFEPILSKKSGTGRKSITGIKFMPLYQEKFRDPELHLNETVHQHSGAFNNFGLSLAEKNILLHKFDFTEKGIKNNYRVWLACKKHGINLLKELDTLATRVANLRPNNPSGYVVNSLKGVLKDFGIKV